MKIPSFLKKIVRYVNPRVATGGLEVSDAFVRYVLFHDGEVVSAQVKLEPGILVDGEIKNEAGYRDALRALHAQIAPMESAVHVIVSLSASGMYSQMFSLPYLAQERIAEATQLNLQMISPIDVNRAYYDAEIIGSGPSGEAELLGAFADSAFIDGHIAAFKSAGFAVAAVEFSALSIARAFRELGAGYDFARPYLLIHIFSSGIDFLIVRNGRLYFHYFSPWMGGVAASGGREIDEATLSRMVRDEFQRVLNFYSGKWSDKLESAVLFGRGVEALIQNIAAEISGLSAAPFVATAYADFFPQWAIAAGAGLRGAIRRADDVLVSLTPVGTEEEFAKSRREHFLVSWRNSALAVFGFVFFVFLLSDSLLARIAATQTGKLEQGLVGVEAQEVKKLRSSAAAFNKNLNLALVARKQADPHSKLFMELLEIAGANITFVRVYHDVSTREVLVSGLAPSELAAINFKNNLAKHSDFIDVALPLANIVQEEGGKVSFQLTFKALHNMGDDAFPISAGVR